MSLSFDDEPPKVNHVRTTYWSSASRPSAVRCSRPGTAPDPAQCPFRGSETAGSPLTHPCYHPPTNICWNAAGTDSKHGMRNPKVEQGSFRFPPDYEYGPTPTGPRLDKSLAEARREAVRNSGGRMYSDHPWAIAGKEVEVSFLDGKRVVGALIVKKAKKGKKGKRKYRPPMASVFVPGQGKYDIDKNIRNVVRVVTTEKPVRTLYDNRATNSTASQSGGQGGSIRRWNRAVAAARARTGHSGPPARGTPLYRAARTYYGSV